jgi:MYXO-CTERM domain-containing protein
VNQALQVSWTGLSTAEVSDLLGYQALCTRGEATQVFKDGTFTAGFDACATANSTWPSYGTLPTSAFVCSDLLPTSATSARLKILENDINYYVGIAAIDKQRNASRVDYQPNKKPILTKDFYFEYRNGDPQGAASGGFCSVSGAASGSTTAVGLGAGLLAALAVTRIRRRRSNCRGSES